MNCTVSWEYYCDKVTFTCTRLQRSRWIEFVQTVVRGGEENNHAEPGSKWSCRQSDVGRTLLPSTTNEDSTFESRRSFMLKVVNSAWTPALQRKAATDKLVEKIAKHDKIAKHNSWPIQPDILSPPLLRLTSRKPLWLDLQPVDIKSRWRHNWKSAQVVNSHQASVWPHNPATRFRPPSATVVSAEPVSHRTGTLRCLHKEKKTYRHWSVSLWQDPDDVSHCRILSPDKTKRRLISATLCRWRRCFVADQLWLMSCIWEEEWVVICKYLKHDNDEEIIVKSVERQLEAHLCDTTFACLPIHSASCLCSWSLGWNIFSKM